MMGKWLTRLAKGTAMGDDSQSARGYRARAEQIRAEANTVTNLATQQSLLRIAANYEQLAHRVEQSSRSNAPDSA